MAVLTNPKYVMTTENTQDQIAAAITFITLAQQELEKLIQQFELSGLC